MAAWQKYTTYHVNVGKNVAYIEDNAITFHTISGPVKLKLKGGLGESGWTSKAKKQLFNSNV